LEVEQELSAVVLYRAQFVQLGIVAVADDAALAQHRRGLGANRSREKRYDFVMRCEVAGKLGEALACHGCEHARELREKLQRAAQSREVARTRGLERNSRGDAFHVHTAFQKGVDPGLGARAE